MDENQLETAMDGKRSEKTSWGVSQDLFDYSEVVTFSTGEGPNQQFFTTNSHCLCAESSYFKERLQGDHPEAKDRHIDLKDFVDPPVLACLLCWLRGRDCSLCDYDRYHVRYAVFLAIACRIPRYKAHLDRKIYALYLRREVPKGQLR